VTKSVITLPSPLDQLDRRSTRHRTLCRGDFLFRQGEKTQGLFYVARGAVNLRRITEAGHEVLMFQARTGDTLAEASLFHKKYHCDAIASESSEIIQCMREAMLKQFRTDIGFALAMSERFAVQVQSARMRHEILSIKNAEERVYRALVEGLLSGTVISFAGEIGLSAEVVYRALSSLSKAGRIQKIGYGRYCLK